VATVPPVAPSAPVATIPPVAQSAPVATIPPVAQSAPVATMPTPIPPGSSVIPPSNPPPGGNPEPPTAPAPAPTPAAVPPPAASNTTTQTITQVQVSTCVSHCNGGRQVQRASQGNTTVQAVGPPVPSDGGAGVAPTRPEKSRTLPTHAPAPASAGSPPTPPVPGVTQVQMGCVEHCHGTTTPNRSGLTLAQIEQLLGQLQPPSPPAVSAVPGNEQNVTQQAAAQSQTGDGSQSQTAGQTNGTVQIAGQGDGTVPVAAVNQTAQGIVQLQVGCIFYCSDTRQTQQAQQSNTTVQSVNSPGAGAANTVSRVVWQVQVGCLVWCYDAVETQTAGASDATVVTVAPPPGMSTPPVEPGEGLPPTPAPGEAVSPPPSTGARTRDSGGAPVRVPGPRRATAPRDVDGSAGRGLRVVAISMSVLAQTGSDASLVSVASSRAVETQAPQRAHHGGRRRSARASRRAARAVLAAPGPTVVAASSAAQPTLGLVIALALAALGLTGLRRRGVR
jgi:hypothetical protein